MVKVMAGGGAPGFSARAVQMSALMVVWALPQEAAAQQLESQPLACGQLVSMLADDGRVALQGVTFDFNRATLRPDSLPALIAARDAMVTLGGPWAIEGHTDAVGGRDYNQSLSEVRALAVRDWMVGAGVAPELLSAAGFGFDRPVADNATEQGRALNRRVELVGAPGAAMAGLGGPDGIDPCPDLPIPGTAAAPPITEWTGSGGQDWLAFSYLMATGAGGGTGWGGARLTMQPGTQPQACQALCLADDRCAAFSFEPAGANFIETASCALIGSGTEVTLRRDNAYFDGGTFHASGLKPDAAILTPEADDLAAQILADMAEIAALREAVRLVAPDRVAPGAPLPVAVENAVPADRHASWIEISDFGNHDFDWSMAHGSVFIHDMADGRSGEIVAPAEGDYVVRYGITHPTAGQHVIAEQPLRVEAEAGAMAADAAGSAATTRVSVEAEDAASVSFPTDVVPGEQITVSYTGPLYSGDWIDIITAGSDSDMSGGWAWAWAEGAPVILTAPAEEGDYTLRYIAEHPERGRVVLAQDLLAVRSLAAPATVPPFDVGALFRSCDGGGMTTCDIALAEGEVTLTLLSDYGITEPFFYETAGGVRADRPSFDVIRLSDGAAVLLVNPRQAQAVQCQPGQAGDEICLTEDFGEAEGLLAGLVFGSLSGPAMATEAAAIGGDLDSLGPAGALQGVWVFQMDMPGLPGHEAAFIVAELLQDGDGPVLSGTFRTSPDLGPLPGLTGDLSGKIEGETLTLMLAASADAALVFTGGAFGGDAYRGAVELVGAPTGAILRKVAGPGEDWSGPPWMTGAPDGMDAALALGAGALQDIVADLEGDDAMMADMLASMLGAMSGAPADVTAAASTTSPEITDLGGRAIDLGGLPAEALLEFLRPGERVSQ